MSTDLFGEEIKTADPLPPGVKKRKETKANGYAARPGSGPANETCKTCANYARVKYAKVYRKCLVIRHRWTHGPGTDIKASSPACSFWMKEPKPHA